MMNKELTSGRSAGRGAFVILPIVGGAALLLGSYLTYAQVTKKQPPPANRAAKDSAQLQLEVEKLQTQFSSRNELDSLAAEVRALKARPPAPAPAPAPAPGAPQREPESEPPMNPEERMLAQRAKNVEVANALGTKLDTVLKGEPVDRDWGVPTADSVSKALSTVAGSHLMGADCRTRLCRIVVQHDTAQAQTELGRQILTGPPFDQEVMFRYDFDSVPPTTTLYLARGGQSLRSLLDESGG